MPFFGGRRLVRQRHVVRDRHKPDSSRNLIGSTAQVLNERILIVEYEQLGSAAQSDLQQSSVFQIDFQQVGDGAEDSIPGRGIECFCTAKDLADADPQAFLAMFEVVEQASLSFPGAALFAVGSQSLLRLVLFIDKFVVCLPQFSNILGDCRLLGKDLVDPFLPRLTFGLAGCDLAGKAVSPADGALVGGTGRFPLRLKSGDAVAAF